MREPSQEGNRDIQPEVSVCLAAYNGERFIREQLESILVQLGPSDELIVCDDNSSDATCSIVSSFDDPRIRLVNNEYNLGHVRNFEKLLTLARGRYIFLSDQDDVWVAGKIKKVIAAFRLDDNISLVYHNLAPIDISGNTLSIWFPRYAEGTRNSYAFLLRQLIRPNIFGCACALDSRKSASLLPFPASVYAHDHWIAVWAAVNGRIRILGETLVHYRKHDSNLTPTRSPSLLRALNNRMKLLHQVGISLYRRCTHGF